MSGQRSRVPADAVTDRAAGLFRGRRIARVYRAPNGVTVLVGKSAQDNDLLSLKLARPQDQFFHVAGQPGSHVIALNAENSSSLDRETLRFAASLAAAYSSARRGGRVSVHHALCADVSKPRGLAPGKVQLRRARSVQVEPSLQEESRIDRIEEG